jgi:CHAT domain-containing protein
LLRDGKTATAKSLLDNVIAQSRKLKYQWFLGRALTAMGSSVILSGNFEQQAIILNEAISTLVEIGATQDASRAKYYLATVLTLAGDLETTLHLSQEALRDSPHDDYLRRSQLYWLTGLQLFRLGYPEYTALFEEKALQEALVSGNPGLITFVLPYVAMSDVARRDYPNAKRHLESARTTMGKIESGYERDLTSLILNLLCATVSADTGHSVEAMNCLNENLKTVDRLGDNAVPYYGAKTLLQLAEIYSNEGDVELARQSLRKAADVLDSNDSALAAASLRMSFENERRDFSDKIAAFEYDHAGQDEAWNYVQRYRSKLFLEFLARMNQSVQGLRGGGSGRTEIQKLIPRNVQVVEYVILPDRLLIWLVSNNKFQSVTVPVRRVDLERRVSNFLKRVQAKGDIRRESADLYGLLIQPIESQLDDHRMLTIIPDQALHRLNFPALYSELRKSYLVERFTILESPSLTSLLSAASGRPSRSNPVAFGAQSDDTNTTQELEELRNQYANLQTFNGTAARKEDFLASLVNANIFHFAGHSQDASDPLRSSILLDGNVEGPNSVTASEITKHKMPANSVVVLASCDSSVGNSRDGIGIRGLTSAFLISGAGSVVGSLWLVEAKNTSKLVLAFHQAFAQNQVSVAEGLRSAQRKFIADGSHPYYWSGFVVTGNLSALR